MYTNHGVAQFFIHIWSRDVQCNSYICVCMAELAEKQKFAFIMVMYSFLFSCSPLTLLTWRNKRIWWHCMETDNTYISNTNGTQPSPMHIGLASIVRFRHQLWIKNNFDFFFVSFAFNHSTMRQKHTIENTSTSVWRTF